MSYYLIRPGPGFQLIEASYRQRKRFSSRLVNINPREAPTPVPACVPGGPDHRLGPRRGFGGDGRKLFDYPGARNSHLWAVWSPSRSDHRRDCGRPVRLGHQREKKQAASRFSATWPVPVVITRCGPDPVRPPTRLSEVIMTQREEIELGQLPTRGSATNLPDG